MGKGEIQQILGVLTRAIKRETASYSYYFRAGRDGSLPDSVRGLIAQLAEEERVHRRLLLDQYISLQRDWKGKDSSGRDGGGISYSVPPKVSFQPLRISEDIDIQAVTLPTRMIGGDNVLVRAAKNRSGTTTGAFVALYDVMGHAIETTRANAFAASILGECLDSTMCSDDLREVNSPSKLITHLNAKFVGEFQSLGVFLTLFSAFIDTEESEIVYTAAGHEPPMILRGDGRVDSLFNTQLIVGIDERQTYTESKIPLNSGDTLCIFTDGILEARNPEGDFYGRDELRDSLIRWGGSDAGAALTGIMGDLRAFCGDQPLQDEVTVVLMRFS